MGVTIRRGLLAAITVLVAAACGGGGGDGDVAGDATRSLTATLAIISTDIETAVDGAGFAEAVEGQALSVGDRVRTDRTGFAEITYHDGSWMRIEHEATATVRALVDRGAVQQVRVSIDGGDAWNRVGTLAESEDSYVLETPVATAAVRGTAFAASCPSATTCSFSVVEGTVTVTPKGGRPIDVRAGEVLEVTAGQEPVTEDPGAEALEAETFIAENLRLDEAKAGDEPGSTPEPEPADADLGGGYVIGSDATYDWITDATNALTGANPDVVIQLTTYRPTPGQPTFQLCAGEITVAVLAAEPTTDTCELASAAGPGGGTLYYARDFRRAATFVDALLDAARG
jgi:mannose-6-phosphate isomerase-like protein (cupin superfamily)